MNTTSLLPDYYTNYYHMFWKITSKLLHNYYVITTSLLPHYYRTITTSLLPNYYIITTSLLPHYYIRSKHYYQLLHNYYKRPPNYFLCKFDPHYYAITSITTYRPLLHDQLLHITTITTITNPHNLEMQWTRGVHDFATRPISSAEGYHARLDDLPPSSQKLVFAASECRLPPGTSGRCCHLWG